MSFIAAVRNQNILMGYCLEDLVPPDARCRFVLKMVGHLNLDALYARYSHQGAQAYDPAMMLALWFMAYSEGIDSTRKLEERCTRDLQYIYLSAHLKPDHTSFSRFRKQHLDLLPDYFVQILRLAQAQGLSTFDSVAGDGTRLQAAASPRQSKDAQELERYLAAVRKDIAEYIERMEDSEDDPPSQNVVGLPPAELDRKKAREADLLKRQRELEARKKVLKAEHRGAHQINLTEPDACLLDQVNGRQKLPAYNGQITVDTASHLIVACEVVTDRNDRQQLSSMHQQTEQNLGCNRQRAYTFDAGYHSLEQLQYIDAHTLDMVVADPTPQHRSSDPDQVILELAAPSATERKQLERSTFIYDASSDCYTCPAGDTLRFAGTRPDKGRIQRIYTASLCPGCALKARCQPKAHLVRRIYRDEREHLAEAMHRRLQTEAAKTRLRLRRMTVETVFGNIKANLGFRRFKLRGLQSVRGEFTLMCIAHNINKLFGRTGQGAFWPAMFYLMAWFWTEAVCRMIRSYVSITGSNKSKNIKLAWS